LKKLGDTEKLTFVVRKGWDPHLTLYPKPVWDALVAELNQRSELDPRVKRYAQAFWNGANEVSLDSADRILLPKRLQSYANGDKSLILTARNDKIEIWTDAEYNQAMEVSPEEMLDLGAELFGGSAGTSGNQAI
ncbi:MAG: division/cell wall cluster transcriptional repressor MraZ, partial [Bacteroidota bacterium]